MDKRKEVGPLPTGPGAGPRQSAPRPRANRAPLARRAAAEAAAPSPPFSVVAPFYNELMRHMPYDHWVEYVLEVLAEEGFDVSRVLDLACGTGSVAIEFMLRGHLSVGADNSEAMLQVAREQVRRELLPIPLVLCDARRMPFGPRFDLVVSLFDSLNYILDEEGLVQCFEGCHRALRSPGYLVFDLNTIRALKLDLFTQDNAHTRDPLQYCWRSHYDGDSRLCTIDMDFVYFVNGQRLEFREQHVQRGYELDEVRRALGTAGFEVRQVYDAYSFRRPGAWSNRVFFVARKG